MMRKIGNKVSYTPENDKEGARLADYAGTNYTSLTPRSQNADAGGNSEDLPQQMYNLPHISDDQKTNVSFTPSESVTSLVKPEIKVCLLLKCLNFSKFL